jgi:transmembrane secretion effector
MGGGTDGAPGQPRRRNTLLAPLRLRDFRLLWIGMTVSLLGDGIFLVAISWQVYELSNAPTALAVVGIGMTVPHILFLLLGGVASDRFDRRRVMIIADVIRGIAVAVLGVLAHADVLHLWHVLAIAGAYGAGTAFFGPAFDAIVPGLVPEDLLAGANSIDQFVRPAAWHLVGPAIGGWLIAVSGTSGAFLLDAATFAVSIAALSVMKGGRHHLTGHLPSTPVREIREGFRYVRSHVWLWGTFLAATIAYLLFVGPSDVLLPFVVKNHMGGTARDLGYVLAAGGVGAILAAIWMGARSLPRRFITFIYVVWTISTLAVAGYGLARHVWQAMIASFTFGALEAAGTIVWATTKQRLVPSRLLGRVSSFDWFISIGLVPVSYALTGPVAAAIGARATLVGAGVIGALATLAFLFLPGMRATERSGQVVGRPALEESAGLVPQELVTSASFHP